MNAAVLPNTESSVPEVSSRAAAQSTAWYGPLIALSATLILTGIVWDISWHSAIGRDTFWTPAHICIHLGGTLGGFVCGWLILRATFFPTAENRAATVNIWGFRGPLGAWVTIWGALAMLTSAPFDNWWHDAYGLDVKILSPPHSILAAGMYFHVAGGLLLLLGMQNRSPDPAKPAGRWLFVYVAGILICLAAIMQTEEALPNQQHTGKFHAMACAVYPFFLIPAARAARVAWPATSIAAVYMGLTLLAVWILPLFPATPKLAPIFNPVKNMVPPAFPLLLIVPAFAVDLCIRHFRTRSGWKMDLLFAACAALAFTSLFITVQWHFSKFLISPEANNAVFAGSQFFTFADKKTEWWHKFWNVEGDPLNAAAVAWAFSLALCASVAGTVIGNWMKMVRR
jgi:hypothetical protein